MRWGGPWVSAGGKKEGRGGERAGTHLSIKYPATLGRGGMRTALDSVVGAKSGLYRSTSTPSSSMRGATLSSARKSASCSILAR